MSNETINKKPSIMSQVGSYAAFPVMQAGISGLVALKQHGGYKNTIKDQNRAAFNKLNDALKSQGQDVFTRAQSLEKGYDRYKDLSVSKVKLEKRFNKAVKKGKLPLKEKILNFFRKDKLDTASYLNGLEKSKNAAISALSDAESKINGITGTVDLKKAIDLDDALKLNNKVFEAGAKHALSGTKSTLKGLGNSVKTNFKNEVGWKNGKLNYALTLLQFAPKIQEDIIPAFKEKGFGAGMKEIGKTIIRMGADLFGYAAGGSIGRVIGSTLGLVLCPFAKGTAAKVGGMIGDALFTVIIGSKLTETVDKMLGVKDETNTPETQNEVTDIASNNEKNQISEVPEKNVPTAKPVNGNKLDTYEGIPTSQYLKLVEQNAFKKQPQGGYLNGFQV